MLYEMTILSVIQSLPLWAFGLWATVANVVSCWYTWHEYDNKPFDQTAIGLFRIMLFMFGVIALMFAYPVMFNIPNFNPYAPGVLR